MKTKKITIEINFPEEQADELIEQYAKSRGFKGEKTKEEFLKQSVIEHIKKSIGSFRMREAMEKVREQQEIAREAAKNVEELEIT